MAKRGELWLVDFGEPLGHEQGYTPSRARGLRRPVERQPRRTRRRAADYHVTPRPAFPIEVEFGESGLEHTSYAKTEDIRSVSTKRLVRRLGSVSVERLNAVEHALRLILGL
jgi:mRNA interferase MazF